MGQSVQLCIFGSSVVLIYTDIYVCQVGGPTFLGSPARIPIGVCDPLIVFHASVSLLKTQYYLAICLGPRLHNSELKSAINGGTILSNAKINVC